MNSLYAFSPTRERINEFAILSNISTREKESINSLMLFRNNLLFSPTFSKRKRINKFPHAFLSNEREEIKLMNSLAILSNILKEKKNQFMIKKNEID
jgi:hypothetical protein